MSDKAEKETNKGEGNVINIGSSEEASRKKIVSSTSNNKSNDIISSNKQQAQYNQGSEQSQLQQKISEQRQRLRPVRPNLRRQAMVASGANDNGAHMIGLTGPAPLGSNIQANLVGPPRRPAHLPATYNPLTNRYLAGAQAPIVGAMNTRLDTGQASGRPANRYAWIQLKQQPTSAWQLDHRFGPNKLKQPIEPIDHHQAAHGFQHHLSPLSSAASRVLVVNPMQIVNLSEHTKSRLIKFIEAIKHLSEKWFSHILLLLFLAVYACLGAYIFISFEASTEQWEKQYIIDIRARIVNESWSEAHNLNEVDYLDLIKARLEDYERTLNRACSSGMTSGSLENQWTFWGALFYSMTVFTTIGYGHLTPITFAGRVATMIYAIFGIPILLMVLADLGKLLTRIIKFAFKQFRNLYNKCMNRKSSLRTRKLISDNTNQYIGVARDAIERGVAYIQPYNDRLTRRVLNNNNNSSNKRGSSKRFLNDSGREMMEESHHLEANLANSVSIEGGGETMLMNEPSMVTTEVIVTPVKQTKPVSPTVNETSNYSNKSHPLSASRSKKDKGGSSRRRKTSSTSLSGKDSKGKTSLHQQQQQQQQAKSISRSASSSLVNHQTESHANENVSVMNDSNSNTNRVKCEDGEEGESEDKEKRGDSKGKEVIGSIKRLNDAMKASKELHLKLDTQNDVSEIIEHEEHFEDSNVNIIEEDEEEEEDEEDDDLDIPVSFALFLLVTYMMFGAVVFSIWEGWNFFDSLYFVFISMSTIGFGDLVPQHPKRMIGTFIYLLFGLALTSMCINVVQEKIHATFLRAKMQIGEKMGLDLDQIMADDYYQDESQLGELSDTFEEDSQSVAVSQGNSSATQAGSGDKFEDPQRTLTNQGFISKPTIVTADDTTTTLAATTTAGGGVKLSKSSSSLRSSRRKGGIASLPGHGNQSGSLWRKSCKNKNRQASNQTTASNTLSPSSSMSSPCSSPLLTTTPSVAAAQVPFPIVTAPSPVSNEEEEEKEEDKEEEEEEGKEDQDSSKRGLPSVPVVDEASNRLSAPQIVDVSDETSKSEREPKEEPSLNDKKWDSNHFRPSNQIDRADSASSASAFMRTLRPKLSSTRSQPTQLGSGSQHSLRSQDSQASYRTALNSSSNNFCYSSGSSTSPRRASLTRELSQLDELIMALRAQSVSGRYGPLLGIPNQQTSTNERSSLSSSPTNQTRRAQSTIQRQTQSRTSLDQRKGESGQPRVLLTRRSSLLGDKR